MKDCIVAVLVGRRDHRPGMPVSGVAAGRPPVGLGVRAIACFLHKLQFTLSLSGMTSKSCAVFGFLE